MEKGNIYNEKSHKGHLLVLFANVIWGLNAPIAKQVLNNLSPIGVTTFLMIGASMAFLILYLFLPKEKVEKRDRIRIFFASLFAVVFYKWVFMF